MSKVIETTVYEFGELSEAAKERARDWYRSCMDAFDFGLECTIEDVENIAAILGIRIEQRAVKLYGGGTKTEPVISYSVGGYNDYCAFAGTYSYAKGSCKAIRDYAPKDSEFHRIADTLRKVQSRYFYRLSASISTGWRGTQVQAAVSYDGSDWRDVAGTDAETVQDCLRDFAAWILSQLNAEYEYQTSNESVDESILANEYTFDVFGNREG